MRRRRLLIVALSAIITFVSLQAFVGHRYGPYTWHRWHHWNQWRGPYEPYGRGWESDSNYYYHHNRWDHEPRRTDPSQGRAD